MAGRLTWFWRSRLKPHSTVVSAALLVTLAGCTAERERRVAERELREAMEEYARSNQHLIVERVEWRSPPRPLRFERREMRIDGNAGEGTDGALLTQGRAPAQEASAGASQPARKPPAADTRGGNVFGGGRFHGFHPPSAACTRGYSRRPSGAVGDPAL